MNADTIYKILLSRPGIYGLYGDRGTRYVGSSSSLLRRYTQHQRSLQRNQHKNTILQAAYNGGEQFTLIPIEQFAENTPLWFIAERERYWIINADGVNTPNNVRLRL